MRPHIVTKVIDVHAVNVSAVIKSIESEILTYPKYAYRKNKSVNICPMCLDTETTTVDINGVKHSFVYIYQLQIGSITLLMRTRDILLAILSAVMALADTHKFYIYCGIANIKYEWSFLCRDFADICGAEVNTYLDPFCPLTASLGRIVVVDICKISGSSLAKIGKDYCTTQKLKEDDPATGREAFDYSKIRNSITKLTDDERAYCINDVVVGAEYLMFLHAKYTCNGKKIPVTSTGVPRGMMCERAYETDDMGNYIHQGVFDDIRSFNCFPQNYKDYEFDMRYLFRGGYTHGNAYYVGDVLHDVEHVDYTSDYPAVMLQEKFATSFAEKVIYGNKVINCANLKSEQGLNKLLTLQEDVAFECVCEFYDLEATTYHSIESIDKAIDCDKDNAIIDNGRIRKISRLKVALTEHDYHIYKRYYKWSDMVVHSLKAGIKTKLPSYVLEVVTEAYIAKAILKEQKLPYVEEKKVVNSAYGCTVQRINIESFRDLIINDSVINVKYPFPWTYLDLSKSNNKKSFDDIVSCVCDKYNWHNVKANAVKCLEKVYKGFNDPETEKKMLSNKTYEDIRDIVIDKLKQRAYRENVRPSKIKGKVRAPKFLAYHWGVYITSIARRRLLDMVADIEEMAKQHGFKPIVVYCDTDSMFLNCHQSDDCWRLTKELIDKYNAKTLQYNINYLRQYNADGKLDDIGQFDWEPACTHFKQLGAKRYLQRFWDNKKQKHIIEATIAGLNKKDFSDKVNAHFVAIADTFDFFANGMTFNELETSKLTPKYFTSAYSAVVTDDDGNTETMYERCGQALNDTPFEMTVSESLIKLMTPRVG